MSENLPSKSEIVFSGKIFEIEQTTQPDGRIFERAVRAPGVRLIIPDRENKKILLTKEFRIELNDWDYRLPGGKVFDSLEDYEQHRGTGKDILAVAQGKAKGEAAEEAGIDVSEVELISTSKLGATVEWDLLTFEATRWSVHPEGQKLEQGEQIDASQWFGYEEAQQMILDGQMQEERIGLILLQWLNKRT